MLTQAEKARDTAIESVTDNNISWMDVALELLINLPNNFSGIGEDIRHFITERIGEPKHHNAWGALIRTATTRGYIFNTGKMDSMQDVQSHARKSWIYTKGNTI